MKKLVLTLSLLISALFVSISMTQPVFATDTESYFTFNKISGYQPGSALNGFLLIDSFMSSGDVEAMAQIGDDNESTDYEFTGDGTEAWFLPIMSGTIKVQVYYGSSYASRELIHEHLSTTSSRVSNSTYEIEFDGGASNVNLGNQFNQSYYSGYLSVRFYPVVNLDNFRPAISGQENFATSVNDLRPLSFFQDFLTAWDETDGDLTDSIFIVEDNYTASMAILGKYSVVFGVSDAAGNETTLLVYINVVDINAPVITGNTAIADISYTQTWNISTFKSTLTVSDNYYNLTNSNIVVESDTYTSNKGTPGTYEVVYSVTDSSNNKGTFTKQVRVIDDVAPVISGVSVITKPSNSILTVASIQAQLTANDFIEGNKTSQITVKTDNYTGFGNVVGPYSIIFEVADSKGNKSTYPVTINVVDNIAPIVFVRDGVSIVLKADEVLTREQIISILQVTEQVQNVTQTTQFSFLIDEYQGNEETPGVYMMSVKVSNVSGNESLHNLMINVLESDTEDDIIVDEPVVEWYMHIWNFIVAAFNFVIDVIVNIWNFVVSIWNWIIGLFTTTEVTFAYKFIR